ncbi:oligopeptide/dipeptide ABC transporter, ATPase subunit [Natrialba chahannaoensis JCM 10990]|uniref:Nickel import system ATP-binding protein NikD n=1 Tax=Natrialba chahannaoensis JCM 10990 TaxID=1227492 RepID=M0ABV4_9EURY|nr:ABC transporter ATP-binding protein [Natrialba chahannaoensis]ELY95347.1 oligopeptide/dipeptide ABC transporter, ATPase subunit [Natrialba chahannaoensis JCM 10990]
MSNALLDVENLHAQFDTHERTVHAVNGVSFKVDRGEIVGLVGESGSGKSVTARSIVGLESPADITDGSVRFDGTDLTECPKSELRRLRGTQLSIVFQDPHSTLNPVFPVGELIAEALKVHESPERQSLLDHLHTPLFNRTEQWRDCRERAIELMEDVGLADPGSLADDYPHEFSGGMRQRAMLAIALACNPDLLIADEPTTALDTTTQAAILDRLERLTADRDMGTLLITHDLGVVTDVCDRVVVMYGGQVMESGPTKRVLAEPRHPYTRGLLACLPQRVKPGEALQTLEGRVPEQTSAVEGCSFAPRCSHARDCCHQYSIPAVDVGEEHTTHCGELEHVPTGEPGSGTTDETAGNAPEKGDTLFELDGVSKFFGTRNSLFDRLTGETPPVRAVDDIDIAVARGETLGIVGESGSGKSTLAGLLAGIYAPTDGTIRLDGEPVGTVSERTHEQIADLGYVFQNPQASINPRHTVGAFIREPLVELDWSGDHEERIEEVLELVDLGPDLADRRPHQLSGGQLQRVAIARAIAPEPQALVLDEPTNGLDISVQAKVLNLLTELQRRLGLTYLLISHDLSVVRHVADRTAVMYLGRIMERGPTERLFTQPTHPYTQALLGAVPTVDDEGLAGVEGDEVPNPRDPPSGCVFHPRCPMAESECREREPPLDDIYGVESRCHFAEAAVTATAFDDATDHREENTLETHP